MKMKNFLSVKCFEQMKRQAIDWEKILANHRLNKGILCRLHKEFQNSREKFQKGKKKNFKIGKDLSISLELIQIILFNG